MSGLPGPNLNITPGAGQGAGGPFNKLVADPGQRLYLGSQGGTLLLGPPGGSPGAMSLTDMQNRTWHLLREDGPDTGFAAPTTGDFNITVVTRDLNIALAQWISQTGLAPAIAERMDNFPVYPVLDYPVPPGLVSVTRIEYTPAGQQTYKLIGCAFDEFDNVIGSVLPNTTGQPYYYRQPFAGYIRLQPQPSAGNYQGPGTGAITFTGSPVAGQVITVTLQNGPLATPVTTNPYTTISTDTTSTVATAVANLINTSPAVTGSLNAFLAQASTSSNLIQLTALNAPGTAITYYVTMSGSAGTASPTTSTYFSPNGDVITFYYSSLGTLLINPLDSPAIPPQFHMAPVYRVLMDYWARKQDMTQAKHYSDMFDKEVMRGKSYVFDQNRATQETIAGSDYSVNWPEGGG